MAGKLFLVSGLTGSGKSTLARAVVEHLPNFEYLQTVTTRERRPTETDTIEYDFVTKADYRAQMHASSQWDHNDIHGNFYGADVAKWNRKTRNNIQLICTIVPDLSRVQQTKDLYEATVITIWLDVPASTARARVANDPARANRIEDTSVKSQFDVSFVPSGDLEKDTAAFAAFVATLL